LDNWFRRRLRQIRWKEGEEIQGPQGNHVRAVGQDSITEELKR